MLLSAFKSLSGGWLEEDDEAEDDDDDEEEERGSEADPAPDPGAVVGFVALGREEVVAPSGAAAASSPRRALWRSPTPSVRARFMP